MQDDRKPAANGDAQPEIPAEAESQTEGKAEAEGKAETEGRAEAEPMAESSAELEALEEADALGDPLQRLEAEKAALEREKVELKEQLLRALAETENTRRRVERERDEVKRYAAIPLLRDLVKVADNLNRALTAVPQGEHEQLEALRSGVALTERELMSSLQRHGVTRLDPLGEPLDPHKHEAMFEVPDPAKAPGTIVQVLEPGWLLHDRLIRPARVAVAKAV